MDEVTRRSQRGREQSLEEDPTKVRNTSTHAIAIMGFRTVYMYLSYGLRLCDNAWRFNIKALILIRYHFVRVNVYLPTKKKTRSKILLNVITLKITSCLTVCFVKISSWNFTYKINENPVFQVNTLNEQEHEKLKQAQILEKLQQAFDASGSEEGSENESVIEAFDMWSPSGPTDAQTLALMLQEQLDAINNEIR